MGIIMMEGFQRFARGPFDYATTGPARPIQADSEWAEYASYGAVADTQNGAFQTAARQWVGIAPDPVIASKSRLGLDVVLPTAARDATPLAYCIERVFPAARSKYTVGFLVRFPLGQYFKDNPTATVRMGYGVEFCPAGRRRLASSASQPRYATQGGATPARHTAAVFSADTMGIPGTLMSNMADASNRYTTTPTFRMGGTADPNGVGISMKLDTDHYVEVEVDVPGTTVKVWVDDVYAGTLPWSADTHAAFSSGFQIRLYRGAFSGTTANPAWDIGGVMVSDIYAVDNSDGVSPATRLGKTTRVLGDSPDTDVSTQFSRPGGFASNSDVVNRAIASNETPSTFLTGDGAGTADVYQTSASPVTTMAGTVYGVQVHARFQNASAAAHELAVTADDGTAIEASLGNVAAGTGVIMKSVVMNRAPSGVEWTPETAARLKYGFKIVS